MIEVGWRRKVEVVEKIVGVSWFGEKKEESALNCVHLTRVIFQRLTEGIEIQTWKCPPGREKSGNMTRKKRP